MDIRLLEGRTYLLGREGHIYIDSPMVSKHHAEIRIIKGRIYLRDLNSTNGTYLLKNNRLVYFDEGYVSSHQPLVIGEVKCTIQSLLKTCGVCSASNNTASDSDDTTILVVPSVKVLKRRS